MHIHLKSNESASYDSLPGTGPSAQAVNNRAIDRQPLQYSVCTLCVKRQFLACLCRDIPLATSQKKCGKRQKNCLESYSLVDGRYPEPSIQTPRAPQPHASCKVATIDSQSCWFPFYKPSIEFFCLAQRTRKPYQRQQKRARSQLHTGQMFWHDGRQEAANALVLWEPY